ncbi:MAG TPA: hypothetical protein EYQ50_13320 [Verrucomicrobiales bacterium]|nr:hypothetical protein [Verrucomicrobiales bacterium]
MKKSALVAGLSRCIGRGSAVALSASGYHVGGNYNGNETASRETVELCIQDSAKVGVEIETRICWVVVVPSSDVLPFTTGEVINLDGGFYIRRL